MRTPLLSRICSCRYTMGLLGVLKEEKRWLGITTLNSKFNAKLLFFLLLGEGKCGKKIIYVF